MRGTVRSTLALGIVAVTAFLIVPLSPAHAAEQSPPWVGSYWGQVQGSSGGDTGGAQCSIWIESIDADTARVSVHVTGLPLLATVGSVETLSDGAVEIDLGYAGAGLDVGAKIKLRPGESGGMWNILGNGSGRAFGLEGSGRVAAQQYYKWIAMPSLADQISGTIDALLGRPSPPAGFPEKGADAPAPPSPVAPFETRPPLSLGDMLAIDMGLMSLLLLILVH